MEKTEGEDVKNEEADERRRQGGRESERLSTRARRGRNEESRGAAWKLERTRMFTASLGLNQGPCVSFPNVDEPALFVNLFKD